MNDRYLKKREICCLLFLFMVLAIFVACKSNTAEVTSSKTDKTEEAKPMKIIIKVNDIEMTATLADNSSAEAMYELLKNDDITVNAHDYGGFEKVGNLPVSLPRNDEDITTSAGDIILYQGNSICFYYSTNSWNFTRLGRIDDAVNLNLKQIYGSGDATFILSVR